MKVDIEIMIKQSGSPIRAGNGHADIKLHCVCNGKDRTQTLQLDQENVTKNETALISCITAMKKLIYPCDVNISINSPYIISSSRYINEWHDNDWKRSGGKPVKNLKLWQQLYMLLKIHKVKFSKLEVVK